MEKSPPGRPRNKWENNTKMHQKEIGWKDVDRTHQTQERDTWQARVNMLMNILATQIVGNFFHFPTPVNFSRNFASWTWSGNSKCSKGS